MIKYYVLETKEGKPLYIKIDGALALNFHENPYDDEYLEYLEWLSAGNKPKPWKGNTKDWKKNR